MFQNIANLKILKHLRKSDHPAPLINIADIKPIAIKSPTITISKSGHKKYITHEPLLTPFEGELLCNLHAEIKDHLAKNHKTAETKDSLHETASLIISNWNATIPISTDTIQKLIYYLDAKVFGWGKLEPLRLDTEIEDISCVGLENPVYIYHRIHGDMETDIRFDSEEELDQFITLFAQKSGKQISLATPIVDASLTNGSRIQLTYGKEVSARGSAFTIRKFRETPYSVIDLLLNRTFTLDEMVYLWLAIEYNHSILIIGGTASGKTTTLNALSEFIPQLAKIVTIEDTRELKLGHGNWHASVVPPSTNRQAIELFDLVTAAMRQRPEYLIVGEVRGKETLAMFQAMNTGHTTFSTFHAGSIKTAVNRLQNPPLNVPKAMIETLDIVLSQKRLYRGGTQIRRCNEIIEIVALGDKNEFQTNTVFSYEEAIDEATTSNVSDVYNDIRKQTGITVKELNHEIERRKQLLLAMASQNITDFAKSFAIIQTYSKYPNDVMQHIDDLTLIEWSCELSVSEFEASASDVSEFGMHDPSIQKGDT